MDCCHDVGTQSLARLDHANRRVSCAPRWKFLFSIELNGVMWAIVSPRFENLYEASPA